MPSRIPRDHIEVLRKHIDNLAFAFIAPLGAHDHCCFCSHEPFAACWNKLRSSHTSAPALHPVFAVSAGKYLGGSRVGEILYPVSNYSVMNRGTMEIEASKNVCILFRQRLKDIADRHAAPHKFLVRFRSQLIAFEF
jgi:hypothetical protein